MRKLAKQKKWNRVVDQRRQLRGERNCIGPYNLDGLFCAKARENKGFTGRINTGKPVAAREE